MNSIPSYLLHRILRDLLPKRTEKKEGRASPFTTGAREARERKRSQRSEQIERKRESEKPTAKTEDGEPREREIEEPRASSYLCGLVCGSA